MRSRNSLRYITKQKIKSRHVELLPEMSFINRYLSYLSNRDKWWLVLLHVVLLFLLLGIVRFDFLSIIKIEKETANILIDQRTSNVATIISMTLAVVGLLLSNLAIKDNQTYKLLFVNSKLYLILYYTLSVILCLMLLSTLRDSLPEPIFQQFVLAGTYLALVILLGIGYLFRTIINFANPSKIQDILTSELFFEAKANLRLNLLVKYSGETFLEIMARHNIQRMTMDFAQSEVALERGVRVNAVQAKLIHDINLINLEIELAKRTGQMYYYAHAITLNQVTKEYIDFVLANQVGVDLGFMDVSRCLILKPDSKLLGQANEYMSYFDKKLQEYSAEGKHTKVDEILSIYLGLFKLNMKHG